MSAADKSEYSNAQFQFSTLNFAVLTQQTKWSEPKQIKWVQLSETKPECNELEMSAGNPKCVQWTKN